MKKIFEYITIVTIAAMAMISCKGNLSHLNLKGDCLVDSLTLASYRASIDVQTHNIVVRVPADYDGTSAMTVDKLVLSEGASADIATGMTLNMDEGQTIRVVNGDLYLDWNLNVLRDEARIYSFECEGLAETYKGFIDEEEKTITLYITPGEDVSDLIPIIVCSEYATVTPANGTPQNFTHDVVYSIDNNTAHSQYTVSVSVITKPSAVFLGIPATKGELDPEAFTACQWMRMNFANSMYVSFDDVINDEVDLSECEVMWWHFHKDGGVDGHDAFVEKAPKAVEAKDKIASYYKNGGALLLTRYAGNLASFIGATGEDEGTTPNNCWGGYEDSPEICGGPWDFRKAAEHPIWEGLLYGDNKDLILCTDKGYGVTNSTSQYHIGTDWGEYKTDQDWLDRTHANILGKGGDGAIVAWEYPAKDGKGGIICIGSGCYDWYASKCDKDYVEKYHKNIATMTKNAFDYLTK